MKMLNLFQFYSNNIVIIHPKYIIVGITWRFILMNIFLEPFDIIF
jgi:hypothetical protein